MHALTVSATVGSSAVDREATRDEADDLRARSSHEVDVEFLDFAEFELVLSQFQAPARA